MVFFRCWALSGSAAMSDRSPAMRAHQSGRSPTTLDLWDHALAALENGQPAQPVEQIKQTAVAGGDVVALDPLRAQGNVGQEMADLARPARVSYVDKAQPVGEPCGRDLGSGHFFARLMAGRDLRLRRAVVKAIDLEARKRHRMPLVRDVDEPQAGGGGRRRARPGPLGAPQSAPPTRRGGHG